MNERSMDREEGKDKAKKGFTGARNRQVHVIPVPYAPENLRLSHDQFVEKRKKEKEANAAADQARAESLKKSGITPKEAAKQETVAVAEDTVQKLKKEIKAVRDKMAADPDNKKLAKELNKLMAKLDEAEDSAEDADQQ